MKDKIIQNNNNWFSKDNSFSYFDINQDNQLRVNKVVDLIKKHSNVLSVNHPKLLDIGCADGRIGSQIIKSTKFQVYGVDSSNINVTKSKKQQIIASTQNVEGKLNFKDNFFDLVFAGEIIEHLFDTKHFLSEINRVLKPNGILIITTPNLAHLPDRIRFLRGLNPTNVSSIHPFLHLHIRPFTLNMIIYALNTTGFSLISAKSTMVIFKWSGDKVILGSTLLAKLWPGLGNTFIIEAKKNN